MLYNSTAGIDTLVLIESLPDGSLHTGRELFETTIAPYCLTPDSLVVEFYEARTRADFLGALSSAHQRAVAGHAPVIHFEVHGDTDGIQLASGETLTWSDLAPLLTQVNEACRMNLLVVAAACHGWHLNSVLRPVTRSPVWALIGPPTTVGERDLLSATKAFYQELFRSFDLLLAMKAMNSEHPVDAWTYALVLADSILCDVFAHYLRDLETEESPEQRASRLVAEVVESQPLSAAQAAKLRDDLLVGLSDHEYWFNFYRKRFLMLDLFPDNEPRFPFRYSDCAKQAA